MAKKTIKERKQQLEDQLKKLREEEKMAENERFIIIGRVIDSECKNNIELKGTLDTMLKAHLTKKTERAIFDLPEIKNEQKTDNKTGSIFTKKE